MNKHRIGRELITAAGSTGSPAGVGYRAGVPRWRCGPGRAGVLAVAAIVLAAFGVPGVPQPAALASSQVLNWTKQHPATHPPGRGAASMAYDAATGTVVLFGGQGNLAHGYPILHSTWVWDGSAWTQQHLKVHPPARQLASMAYDASNGTVVLFGGVSGQDFGDTWVWNGSAWAKKHPKASPPARWGASMAYDAANGTVVLFGGEAAPSGPGGGHTLHDTWAWNGSTWTQKHPATKPPGLLEASMAYDAANGSVVLFGGVGNHRFISGDTWAWNGSTWTDQAPVTSPPSRWGASMAYDAATSTVVLFGGYNPGTSDLADTWTWDGTNWTEQAPVTSPPAEYQEPMAYDAATSTVVLFDGSGTWTWGSN